MGTPLSSLSVTPIPSNNDTHDICNQWRTLRVASKELHFAFDDEFGANDLETLDVVLFVLGDYSSTGVVSGIGVSSALLGTLKLPGQPDVSGIRVGISLESLMSKLRASFSDIVIKSMTTAG